jgi:hypothetical protein
VLEVVLRYVDKPSGGKHFAALVTKPGERNPVRKAGQVYN